MEFRGAGSRPGPVRVPARWLAFPFLAVALAPSPSAAQPVFAPLTRPRTEQSANNYFATNGVTGKSVLSAASPDEESRNPLRWGFLTAHPRIDYQYISASGIRQSTSTVSTIQHVISPGIGVQVGPRWNVDAGVALNYYTDKALQDTVGYNVGISGGSPWEEWIFGVSAGFASSESTQVETAQQTKQDSYNLGFSASYGSARRLNFDFSVNQNIALTGGFNDTYGWSTMNWMNYVVTPRTTVGLGLGGGYTILTAGGRSFSSSGTDSANEQLQGRIVLHPLPKLSFSLSGGGQIQHYLTDDGVESSISPIFSVSAGYSPVDGTYLALTGSRTVGTSILSDQHTETTTLSLGFTQRLLKRLTLSITPNYGLTEFQSNTDPSGSPARTDETLGISFALSTVLLKKLAVSTFFSYSDNSSDDETYSFETRQIGVQVGYRF